MEDQTSAQLWKKSQTQGPLRRPRDNCDVSQQAQNGPSKEVNATATGSTSRLSADAKEFFPKNYNSAVSASQSSKSSAQERLLKIKQNQPPGQHDQTGLRNDGNNACPDQHQVEQDKRRLENMISTLILDPGQFDNLLHLFVETFKPHLENHDVINIMAEMLVFQSTNVPNFRYTGARLCKVLEQISPFFRTTLHLICSRELESRANLQGLIIFLGELYSQLHYENVYGKSLICAMKSLLEIGDDASVKCVCQVLKLAGYSLSLYDTSALEDIFAILSKLRPSLGPSVANLLNAVLKLKNEGWGMSSSVSSTSSSASLQEEDNCYIVEDNTVYYNPIDGTELAAEEKVFFADHLQPDYTIDGEEAYSDPDELCDPEPEMDEEIQAAFKEFLKLSKQ